jgi:hypothetical protein
MLDTAEVNRRLTHHLADLQKASAQRRVDIDEARRAFEDVLEREVAPTVRQLAQVLKSRGFSFSVQTPAGAVRLVSERSGDDFLAVELDVTRRPLADERLLREGAGIASLDAEHTLDVLLELIEPFVEK